MTECSPSDLTVAPRVTGDPTAGEPVLITLGITSATAQPCRWTVSPDTIVVKIQSHTIKGDHTGLQGEKGDVWTTEVCDTAVPKGDLLLQPGVERAITLVWQPFPWDNAGEDGRYCPGTYAWMKRGGYTVYAAALGGEPSAFDFQLN